MKKQNHRHNNRKSSANRNETTGARQSSTDHDEESASGRTTKHPSFKLDAPITIDSMAFGGRGVGRHDGKVYFVENAIEGDIVDVEVTQTSERYNEAKVSEIRTPSSFRGPSPCVYSEQCGGCQWQGIEYSQQIVWKKHFVTNALKRIGRLGEAIEIETMPFPISNEYRNRIFVRARITTEGALKVGYFKRGCREFVAIDKCMIASPRINKFLEQLSAISFASSIKAHEIQNEVKFRFEIQDLPIASDDKAHILLSVYDPDETSFPVSEITQRFSKLPQVSWVGSQKELPLAPPVQFERHLEILFHTSAGQFQQVNIEHNHTIRKLVKDTIREFSVKKNTPLKILDLFCGSGNLSLGLADNIHSIEGIEFSRKAIEIAKFNVEVNKLKNIDFTSGDTEKHLWNLSMEGKKFDAIIADPPRDGMFKSLIPLMKLKAELLIYVSCDPTTLSRDLSFLCKREYQVQRFIALDFFPNTYHIESFVVLSRIER